MSKWLKRRAKSIRRKNRLHARLTMTGRRLFHHEEWKKTIRPKVVERMKRRYPKGPFTSKHPRWLKTMKKVECRLWLAMSDAKRKDYIKRAHEINKGEQSQKAKAE